MHYSFRSDTENMKPGKTIVFSNYNDRDFVFGKVITNDYKNGLTVDLSDGRKLKFHTENWSNTWKDQDGKSGYYIKWTNLIPNLPDDEVFSYLKAIDSAKERPIFIHVDSVEDGKITGRFITRTPDSQEHDTDGELLDVGEADEDYARLDYVDQDGVRTIGLPAVIKTYSKRFPEGTRPVSGIFCNQDIEPGDLIIGDDINMYYVDDELITVINNTNSASLNHGINVVKKNASLDDIRAFLLLNVREEDVPAELEPEEPNSVIRLTISGEKAMFMPIDEIENQLWQARLRLQPDEAIVLWLDDDRRKGDTNPFILGFTGHLLNVVDDVQSYIELHGVEEGLWLMKNPTFNGGYDYEGNYDCDLDADYVPATPEDFQRLGIDMECVVADIIDSLDGRELDEGVTDLVAHFMEKSRIAHEEELERQNSMKP